MAHDEEVKRIQTEADFLQTAYLKCKSFAESESRNLSMSLSASSSSYENKENLSSSFSLGFQQPEQEQIQRVSKELEQIYSHLKGGIQTGAFQWIDSKLIKVVPNAKVLLLLSPQFSSMSVHWTID